MASEDYYRPYRDDLLNYDPAQALAITREGAAQRQDFEARAGQDRVLAEERKWDRIGEIPTKLLEGYERGTKTARERGRDEREQQSFAEERALRSLQTQDTRERMEDAARQRGYENEIVSGGKSRYQTMKDAELEGLVNAPKMERERLDLSKKQIEGQNAQAAAALAMNQRQFALTERQAKIEEAKTLFGPALASGDPAQAEMASAQLAKMDLTAADIQAVRGAALAQKAQTERGNDAISRATYSGAIERVQGFNDANIKLAALDAAIKRYEDAPLIGTEQSTAKQDALDAMLDLPGGANYATALKDEVRIDTDDLRTARKNIAAQLKAQFDVAKKATPDAARRLSDVDRTITSMESSLAAPPQGANNTGLNMLTTYGSPSGPMGNKNVYAPVGGQPGYSPMPVAGGMLQAPGQQQQQQPAPPPMDFTKMIRYKSGAGARK